MDLREEACKSLDTDAGFGFVGDHDGKASEVEAGLNDKVKDELWDENAKE